MMVTVVAEGCDYSSTENADWDALAAALVAQGKTFAGRYAVYDKSPSGRGITNAEYRALMARKIDTFLYYEETEKWMLDGWSAGVRAATRALDVIRTEGMPEGMPVRYSHDVDPTPDQFAAIDDCLDGAASVVGWDRVGAYGGWLLIDHLAQAGKVRYLCQTLAWQYGRGVHPAADLHQYGFNQFIAGTNCDFVAALKPHYGQASDFLAHPTTTTTPSPHPTTTTTAGPAPLPKGMSTGVAARLYNPHGVVNPATKEVLKFQRGATVSEAWLTHVLSTNPHGKTWQDYQWPALESSTLRGDGRRVFGFSDGFTVQTGEKN